MRHRKIALQQGKIFVNPIIPGTFQKIGQNFAMAFSDRKPQIYQITTELLIRVYFT